MSDLLPQLAFLAVGGSIAPPLLLLTILFLSSHRPLPNLVRASRERKTVSSHRGSAMDALGRAILTAIVGAVEVPTSEPEEVGENRWDVHVGSGLAHEQPCSCASPSAMQYRNINRFGVAEEPRPREQ
jgi:hypothetical protein